MLASSAQPLSVKRFSPFRFDVVIPLVTEEIEPGVFEIVGTEEARIDNVDMSLESTGGIVCALFEALQGPFLDLLLTPLAEAASALAKQLNEVVVGLLLCE